MKTLILSLFLMACSSSNQMQNESQEVLDKFTHYYEQWHEDFNPKTKAEKDFAEEYQHYLRSVASIFLEAENTEQVDLYLDGLRQMDQKLNVVQRPTEPKIRLSDQLNQQRYQDLEQNLKSDVFDKIIELNEEYSAKYEGGKEGYNYPI